MTATDHMPDDAPTTPRNRVRVFVDFWNYTLSMRQVDSEFRTDWSALGPVLAQAAGQCTAAQSSAQYQGLNFYGSYDPNSTRDRSLRRWATTVVDRFAGVSVSIVPRQRKPIVGATLVLRQAKLGDGGRHVA